MEAQGEVLGKDGKKIWVAQAKGGSFLEIWCAKFIDNRRPMRYIREKCADNERRANARFPRVTPRFPRGYPDFSTG